MNYSALTRTHKPVHVTAFVVDVVEVDVAGTDEPPLPPHAATKVTAPKMSALHLKICFNLFITYLSLSKT
jgi:bisphosphoglycerate-independent phosphoglycerate mutase (AlkP superfamily)